MEKEIPLLDNPLFHNYAFYSAILVIKMLLMSPLTSRSRLSRNIFANPEDSVYFDNKKSEPKLKLDDVEVERVRRAHLNDLENIPAFVFISALYTLTSPAVAIQAALLLSYTLSRVAHTFVYAVVPLPQPARALAWGAGYTITLYMALQVLISCF